jgi:hypothetical protein
LRQYKLKKEQKLLEEKAEKNKKSTKSINKSNENTLKNTN